MKLAVTALVLALAFLVLGLIGSFRHEADWASYMVASNVWSAASIILSQLEARRPTP